jgi:hypothetical protein
MDSEQTPDEMESAFERDHDEAEPHHESFESRIARTGNVDARIAETTKMREGAQDHLDELLRSRE